MMNDKIFTQRDEDILKKVIVGIIIWFSILSYTYIAAYHDGINEGRTQAYNEIVDFIQDVDCNKDVKIIGTEKNITFKIECPEPIFVSSPYRANPYFSYGYNPYWNTNLSKTDVTYGNSGFTYLNGSVA